MSSQVLVFSENDAFVDVIRNQVGDLPFEYRHIRSALEIKKIEITYKPYVVLIDSPSDKTILLQIYDGVYDRFRNSKIIVLYDKSLSFEVDQIGGRKQNMTFLQYRFEGEVLLSLLLEYVPVELPTKKLKLEHMNPISMSDLRASDKLAFDLYLHMPLNNKLLLYRNKNTTLNETQLENFSKFGIHDLFVRKTDMRAVRQYFADKLKKTFGSKKLSKTEKRLQLQKDVRDIFGNFFDPSISNFSQNKIIFETCKKIVGQFITEISPHPGVYEKILFYTSQNRTNYAHAANVSVYCGLFAIALGYEDVEAAAIGGLLHDIGIASLPEGITDKSWDEMKDDEKRIYRTHTDAGLKFIDNKKLITMENVRLIISQHHERMDGTGYPSGLKKDQIDPYVRLAQIADELDELTSITPRSKLMSPAHALDHMITTNKEPHESERFDSDILLQLKSVLMPPAVTKIELDNVRDIFSKPVDINDPNINEKDVRRRRRAPTRRG